MRCALLLTTFLLFASSPRADDAKDLLRKVSAKYDVLTNYEFVGTESAPLTGTACTLEFGIKAAAALPEFLPTIQFHGGKISEVCLDAVKKLGSIGPPGEWLFFNTLENGVIGVSTLPEEILKLPGEEIHCSVLEVLYDDYHQKLRSYDGPVRYWVDSDTNLVRRVQFTEMTEQGPRFWTATLEKVSIGGPPALWLSPTSAATKPPPLIGKAAPDFELRTSDGQRVRLTELRGTIVALDFWATWCTACDEELPTLEELQTEKASTGVALFGVTKEPASEVRKWLSQYKRSFVTLVDAKKTFDDFAVGPIPAIVIIDRQGVVAAYDLGFHSVRAIQEFMRNQVSD